MRRASIWCVGLMVAVGCSGDSPTDSVDSVDSGDPADSTVIVAGDPVAGGVAFRASCAECHASGDGFDLAYFGFSDADIVRRAVGHVDSTTAHDIVGYIHSLGVTAGGGAPPFQPLGRTDLTDFAFWKETFGTDGWPGSLTPDLLRARDPRAVAVPLHLLPWSSEEDESDWMPERPLPGSLLSADGGALRSALDSYLSAGTTEALVAAIDVFQDLTYEDDETAGKLCAGRAGIHADPEACFEARRWMSSLAAIHFIRSGESGQVPFAVAKLWWDTGDSAVTLYFRLGTVPKTAVAGWLYLASTYVPDGFPGPLSDLAEDSGYMGQFLQSSLLNRLALFATLRRMVDRGPVHTTNRAQSYWDLYLAVTRSPYALSGPAMLFGLQYLDAEARAGRVPSGELADFATGVLDGLFTLPTSLDAEGRARAEALASDIKARIAGG